MFSTAHPAQPGRQAARKVRPAVLCGSYQHITTTPDKGVRYVIRNDDYGHKEECISNQRDAPNFTVVQSAARVDHAEPVAFPNIFLGCSWGVCSPGSVLPARVSRLRSLTTSWSTTERATGTWAVGYDIWFDRVRRITGQSRGAELMIWLDSRGTASAGRWPVVVVRHVRYRMAHWRTGDRGKSWTYIQFRRATPTSRVARLDVRAFVRVAERDGLIRPRWWLTSVEAGFEIWRGGVGLRTTGFAVRV